MTRTILFLLACALAAALSACGDDGGASDAGADAGTDTDTDTDSDADAGNDGGTDTETPADPVVVATIPVGQMPRTIAVSDDDAFVYVPNTQSANVSVIDAAAEAVSDTLSVGPQPFGAELTPDGAYLFVTQGLEAGGGGITIVDTSTGDVAQTLTDAVDGGRGIAFSPDGDLAFACSHWDGRLKVFDVAAVVADPGAPPAQDLATGTSPVMIAVTADGATVYVGNAEGESASVFDTSDWSSHLIDLPGVAPVGIALGSSDGRLFVADKNGNLVVIETLGETITDSVPTGPETVGVAASPEGGWIWAVVQSENRVAIVDPDSLEIASEVMVGAGPFAIGFSHDAARAYVSNMGEGTVSVIETNGYR